MRTLIFCSLFFTQFLFSQQTFPQDYFQSPLGIPIVLSGSFGELRSNHFHSGLDIKTQQREGLDVFAAAQGYVSRIKIQHYGYGKAIYLSHPNGYTTVYAHLQSFSPKLQAYVKEKQYQKQSYEIELFPEPGELSVAKGELIAYSGNTGGSGGPHLHYEIRNANSEPINPLLFGYQVKDTKAPRILGVYGYALKSGSVINNTNNRIELRLTKKDENTYLADKIYAQGTIGLGVETYDQFDMAYNKNGAYKICTKIDGVTNFEYNFTSFSFSESRYINTLIDYPTYVNKRKRIQKCYIEPYNRLSIYNKKDNNGLITVEQGKNYTIHLEVSDLAGNVSVVEIPIEGRKQDLLNAREDFESENYLICERDNIYRAGKATIYFPKNSFYHDLFLDLQQKGDTIKIHNHDVPMRKNYTLSLELDSIKADIDKYFIASISDNGHLSYQNTYRKSNILSTRTRTLGDFIVSKDTIAPTIRPSNFQDGQWLSNFKTLKLIITDDLSGINTYKATINNQWVLMEYDYKENTLTYDLSDIDFKDTMHRLEVVVTDNVGNSTTYKAVFHQK
ncbi:M23 family metallopeptidase [Galbibacter sp.]|uniref:M23 family metallopeptidase n=1 Tax=Galbibacter sp. TaxID=2918471 RepID=UPI002B8BB06C|nr:M23 family metallopeptidase [Galbibacter sp.]HLV62072.1 M23 family metallopeptidase [Galbibacter sp.]